MRHARVGHSSCGEESAVSHVLIPDDWTQDDFDNAAYAAQKAYLEFLKEYNEQPKPVNPGIVPKYSAYPDLTVKEVERVHAEKTAQYNEWVTKNYTKQAGFMKFLRAQGVVKFTDEDGVMLAELDWGHRHGVQLDWEADEAW